MDKSVAHYGNKFQLQAVNMCIRYLLSLCEYYKIEKIFFVWPRRNEYVRIYLQGLFLYMYMKHLLSTNEWIFVFVVFCCAPCNGDKCRRKTLQVVFIIFTHSFECIISACVSVCVCTYVCLFVKLYVWYWGHCLCYRIQNNLKLFHKN